ncbi:MAG: lipopolysaccharide heptosyltransferase II [Planctomycetota bacterium]|nr:lipopolysaccharide heptosyltransferase II [Planctomycetota bacterium]
MKSRSLVVRAPNWLGDCIMSLPCLEALRAALPEAHLLIACREHLRACYEAHPAVNGIIPAPASGLARAPAFWRTAMALRGQRIETGLLLTNSFSSALWLWLGGVKDRIGFARDGRRAFLTRAVPLTPNILAAHQSEYYLHLAAQLGASPAPRPPRLFVPDAGREEAKRLLCRVEAKQPYAVIAPASAYGEVKDWPAEHFAWVVEHLLVEKNWDVLLVGSAGQQQVCERIAAQAQADAANGRRPAGRAHALAGATSLGGFFGLLEQAALFLGNDSGGAHAAAALGVPTVVIFGITEPGRTRPLGARVAIIGEGGYVTPDLRSPRVRRAAAEALRKIEPLAVWEGMQKLLASAADICN